MTSIHNSEVTHVIVGQMAYGKGESVEAAEAAFVEAGGSLKKSHTIVDFSHPAVHFDGVTNMGDVLWSSDDEDIEPGVKYV